MELMTGCLSIDTACLLMLTLYHNFGICFALAFRSGNFAPVHEEVFSDELEITGTLPKHLDGLYVRTGLCTATACLALRHCR